MRAWVSRRSLVLGALTGIALVTLWVTPAFADNCSVFTDCFGQANSAAVTALGLGLLTALSLVLDFIPVVGDVKGLVEGATGRDLLTGQELEPWERALGLIPLLPVGDLLGVTRVLDDALGAGRHGDDVLVGAGRGGRHADGVLDGVGGGGRHGDDVLDGPGGRPSGGDGWRADGYRNNDELVEAYNDPGTTTAQRRAISEELGENGAMDYLERTAGVEDLGLHRAVEGDDFSPLVDSFEAGEAWDEAVAFGGSRATNVVYWDGDTLHIIEAKGGSGAYGTRIGASGERISQTDPDYPLDVAHDMSASSKDDGRNVIGDIIQDAYEDDAVSYVGVRTGGRGAILDGSIETTLEHVFKTPGG